MPKNAKRGPTTNIEFDDVIISVGHLSLSDLAELRREHVVRLLDTLGAYKDFFNQVGEIQRSYGALVVFLEMSDAIGHLISLSNPQIDRSEAGALPVGVQIRALVEIAQLSASGEVFGGLIPDFADLLSKLQVVRPEDIN